MMHFVRVMCVIALASLVLWSVVEGSFISAGGHWTRPFGMSSGHALQIF